MGAAAAAKAARVAIDHIVVTNSKSGSRDRDCSVYPSFKDIWIPVESACKKNACSENRDDGANMNDAHVRKVRAPTGVR